MALKALIIGKSGSGKTFGFGTLPWKETFYFSPDKKLPQTTGIAPREAYKMILKTPDAIQQVKQFGWDKNFKISDHIDLKLTNFLPFNQMFLINRLIRGINDNRKDIHYVVIDTVTHGMFESVMHRRDEDNWGNFIDFAGEFYDMVDVIPDLREDLFVFFTAHDMEDGKDTGARCMQIPAGKLTAEKFKPESRFDEVLWANVIGGDQYARYYWSTQNNGLNTVRARVGVFPSPYISNDALYVAQCIRAYEYGTEKPEPKTVTL